MQEHNTVDKVCQFQSTSDIVWVWLVYHIHFITPEGLQHTFSDIHIQQ